MRFIFIMDIAYIMLCFIVIVIITVIIIIT